MVQISSNPTLFTRFQLEKNNNALKKDVEQLSTGKRINRASDDAASSGIATSLLTQVNGIKQATQNTQDGFSVLQVAEAGLSDIGNFLHRVRVLAVQAANDVLTSADRQDIQIEVNQIVAEIDRLHSAVQFNTLQLLNRPGIDAEEDTLTLHVGPNQNETLDLSLKIDASRQALGITTLDVSTRENANNTIQVIDNAFQTIAEHRSNIGSEESRLTGVLGLLDAQFKNMTEAHSTIENVDFANTLVKLTRDQIIQNSGVSAAAQANSNFTSSLGSIVSLIA